MYIKEQIPQKLLPEDQMPEEFQNYIKAEYERLREKANTYGELDKLICERSRGILSRTKTWKNLLYEGLNKLLTAEVCSLPIQQTAHKIIDLS